MCCGLPNSSGKGAQQEATTCFCLSSWQCSLMTVMIPERELTRRMTHSAASQGNACCSFSSPEGCCSSQAAVQLGGPHPAPRSCRG